MVYILPFDEQVIVQCLQVNQLPSSSVASHPGCHLHLQRRGQQPTIACLMIDHRLDYCNGLLYGASAENIHNKQRVQSAVARAVTNLSFKEHAKHVLAPLHWLPFKYLYYSVIENHFHRVQSAKNTRTKLSNRTYPVPYLITPPAVQRLQSPTAKSG